MSAHQSILHPGDVCDCGRRATQLCRHEPVCERCARLQIEMARKTHSRGGYRERTAKAWENLSRRRGLRYVAADPVDCYRVML